MKHHSISAATRNWWQKVKNDDRRFRGWLEKQYHGEVTAAERIERYVLCHVASGTREHLVLTTIAQQERWHAEWVAGLLRARGWEPKVLAKDERYWEKTLPSIRDLETGAAVAAHAEKMRLERIYAIAEDADAPADVREVFKKILPQEQFHARAFAEIAGEEALEKTAAAHTQGLAALGLINLAEVL